MQAGRIGPCIDRPVCLVNALSIWPPPIKYANILNQSHAMRSACAGKMRRDWDAILRLEADSVTEASAKEVAENAQLMVPEAARLAFMLFERGHFDPCFAPFQSYMRALLDVLPDSRIVEQTHQHLRKMENENANNVSSRLARQNACVFSGVLQERGLPAVTLQEEEFCCRMRAHGVGVPSMKRAFDSRPQKLPRAWSDILHPGATAWRSPTPASSRSSSWRITA